MSTEKITFPVEEVTKACLEYFTGDELAASVVMSKYLLRSSSGEYLEKGPDDLLNRVAKEFARIEKKYQNPVSFERIKESFDHFKYIIPQGSPLFGIGNFEQICSIANCFVVESPYDSYGGILKTDEEIAQLMKRRGGVGVDISTLRPSGTPVNNAARSSDGIACFMERYSNTTKEVAQGGRRGALLISLSCLHPEIDKFIDIKRNLKKVTGANISVKWNDEFLDAVQKDSIVTLRWPVDAPLDKAKVKREVKARDIWKKFIRANWESAEPGCYFWDTMTNQSLSDCYKEEGFETLSTNPCLVGETKVYVADGRANVSIKQLAEEGKDVKVFCYDDKGVLKIRTMRNPRITGYKQQIYKVKLDDGYEIRATGNHKLRLLDGSYKEIKDLIPGDSLKIITKFEASIKEIFKSVNSNSQDYYWINNNNTNFAEHRLIASDFYNDSLKDKVVHHKDYNAKNNRPDNLNVMSKEDHDYLHNQNMFGDKNPIRRAQTEWSEEKWKTYHDNMSKAVSGEKNGMFTISNIEFKNKAKELCKKVGRKFTEEEWKKFAIENNLPVSFSKFRKRSFGMPFNEFISSIAEECGVGEFNDRRISFIKKLSEAKAQGYNTHIIENTVYVEKTCENCKKIFIIPYSSREISFCTRKCYDEKNNFESYKSRMQRKTQTRSIEKNKKQMEIYCTLKNKLLREPFLKEWKTECIKNKVPYRLKTTYGFETYTELKEKSSMYNHRVVSIELDGIEDVYNGTVDDFHNFFIGAFESKTNTGKNKWCYVNNLQCGEIGLSAGGSCILMLLNLNSFVESGIFNFAKFEEEVRLASRLIDDMIEIELEKIHDIIKKIHNDPEPEDIKKREINLWKKIEIAYKKGRRVGLGVTALGDCIASMNLKYDSDEAYQEVEKVFSKFHTTIMDMQADLSKERGHFECWNWEKEKNNHYIKLLPKKIQDKIKEFGRRNISISTCSPAGSVSILTQTTSGIEPLYMRSYIRRRKMTPDDKAKGMKPTSVDHDGIEWTQHEVFHNGVTKWTKENPGKKIESSPFWKCQADEINWINRVKLQSLIQKYISHSLSSTLNLPANASETLIEEIYLTAWKSGCKGITIYRDGCREGILSKKEVLIDCDNLTKIGHTCAPKRPDILECDIQYSKFEKGDWIFLVGKLENEPYEIFGGAKKNVLIPKKYKNGWIVKNGKDEHGRRTYDLVLGSLIDENEKMVIKDIAKEFTPDSGSYTRLISTMLRHGIPIKFICEQLNKDSEASLFSMEKVISRVIKKYIKDGEVSAMKCECGGSMRYKDGCVSCDSCGNSKCG